MISSFHRIKPLSGANSEEGGSRDYSMRFLNSSQRVFTSSLYDMFTAVVYTNVTRLTYRQNNQQAFQRPA